MTDTYVGTAWDERLYMAWGIQALAEQLHGAIKTPAYYIGSNRAQYACKLAMRALRFWTTERADNNVALTKANYGIMEEFAKSMQREVVGQVLEILNAPELPDAAANIARRQEHAELSLKLVGAVKTSISYAGASFGAPVPEPKDGFVLYGVVDYVA